MTWIGPSLKPRSGGSPWSTIYTSAESIGHPKTISFKLVVRRRRLHLIRRLRAERFGWNITITYRPNDAAPPSLNLRTTPPPFGLG